MSNLQSQYVPDQQKTMKDRSAMNEGNAVSTQNEDDGNFLF